VPVKTGALLNLASGATPPALAVWDLDQLPV